MASSFRWGNTSSLTQEATDIGEGGYSGLSKEVVAEYKWPLRQVAMYCETRAVRGAFMENQRGDTRALRWSSIVSSREKLAKQNNKK